MVDILIDSKELDVVRNAIGVDSTMISDSLIESLQFLPFVEASIKEFVTDWSTVLSGGGLDATRLKLGAGYWTAARLIGYLEYGGSTDYKLADYSQRGVMIDWKAKAKKLMHEAASQLAQIAGQVQPGRVTLFSIAGPTRSRAGVPSEFEEWLDMIEPSVIDWLEDEQT